MTMTILHAPKLIAAIGALLSLTGCNEHVTYHSYRHVPGSGWSRRDTLTFDIDTVRAEATYQFELGLRSTDSYPYTVIWLAVEREFSHPDTLRRDTVKCQLMDPVTHRKAFICTNTTYRFLPWRYTVDKPDKSASYISCNGKSFRAYTMWEFSSAAKALIPLGQIASGIYAQEHEQQDGEAPQG